MRLLIVDDSQSDRTLATREISKSFPDATFTEVSSAEAFEAELRAGNFDVVITDYRMGWMNGLEVLREVKAKYPTVPVIMLTGTGNEEVAVEAMREGAEDYLLKNQLRFDRLPRAVAAAREQARQRLELAEAERRYGNLFRSVPVGLCQCTPDGRILEANPALAALLGVGVDRAEGLHLPGLFEGDEGAWGSALAGDAPEVRLRRPDGETVWAVLRVREIPGASGAIAECALADITASKRAADEREALLGELYHRVNNTLQILIGMVTAQAAQVTDPAIQAMLRDLASRIHAISLVQQRLYETGTFTEVDFGDFLRDLAESLVGSSGVGLRLNLLSLPLPVTKAIPLGLAANELVTNCLKHAFVGCEPGEIAVRIDRKGDQAVMEIADDGIGLPPAPKRREGYGTRLLRALIRQAGAEMTTDSLPRGGTRTRIHFPLDARR